MRKLEGAGKKTWEKEAREPLRATLDLNALLRLPAPNNCLLLGLSRSSFSMGIVCVLQEMTERRATWRSLRSPRFGVQMDRRTPCATTWF